MRKIIVWHKHVKSWSVPMLLWTWKWNGVTSIAYYMHIYAHLPWHFDPILSLTTPNRPHRKKEFIYIYIKAKPWSSFLRTSRHHATVDGAVKRLQLKNGICYFLMRLAICIGKSPDWVAGMIMKPSSMDLHVILRSFAHHVTIQWKTTIWR